MRKLETSTALKTDDEPNALGSKLAPAHYLSGCNWSFVLRHAPNWQERYLKRQQLHAKLLWPNWTEISPPVIHILETCRGFRFLGLSRLNERRRLRGVRFSFNRKSSAGASRKILFANDLRHYVDWVTSENGCRRCYRFAFFHDRHDQWPSVGGELQEANRGVSGMQK